MKPPNCNHEYGRSKSGEGASHGESLRLDDTESADHARADETSTARHTRNSIMNTEVVWYGERGVVNALVTDIAQRGAGTVPAVQQLLGSAVQWAGGTSPAWINDIARVALVVEVGLNDFGDPDLILVCWTGPNKPQVVFLEAKVVPYLGSALKNSGGMVAGFNSSINGQLSLKYRFSLALEAWDGQRASVAEPAESWQWYRRPASGPGLADPARQPRRLAKAEILEGILTRLDLFDLPSEHAHFVALTWDSAPFWSQVTGELLPLFLTTSGANGWATMQSRTGWVGFEALERVLSPGEEYRKVRKTMIATLTPPVSVLHALASNLPTLPLRQLGEFQQATRESLAVITQAARDRFGPDAVKVHAGSVSIVPGKKVLVKLVPQGSGADEYLLLGVSASLEPHQWPEQCALREQVQIASQPFFVTRLSAADQEARLTADAVFAQVALRRDGPTVA
ncbi:MAG: hypothetical protein JNM56_22875 [Planctomycetia bacterium]|nr:hypothetical protein [Planctomycetia bacterium]